MLILDFLAVAQVYPHKRGYRNLLGRVIYYFQILLLSRRLLEFGEKIQLAWVK
jgi:hypothetical protein